MTTYYACLGFLSAGHGAASKVLSKYITQCDIPASQLGTPRALAVRKAESEMQSETGDEDQPEIEPEPEINTELEGLFVCLFTCFCSLLKGTRLDLPLPSRMLLACPPG